jgi:large repetitive protein
MFAALRNLTRTVSVKASGILLGAALALAMSSDPSAAYTLRLVDQNGSLTTGPFLPTGYRWLLQEDLTYVSPPNVQSNDSLGVNFHRSYMPVVNSGDHTTIGALTLDPTKRYFISVVPDFAGPGQPAYMSGGTVIVPGQTIATVRVADIQGGLPTAQITVLAFQDRAPINGVENLPEETGLEGFLVEISDSGGRYGMVGGQITFDVFGNPLGTTYLPDGTVDIIGSGNILTGPDGYASIKNLAPGKYGIRILPPDGQGWQQTSTIEGSKTIDAWVKANEPVYFAEFGPASAHVRIGFVQPFNNLPITGPGTAATVSGTVNNMHMARPPNYGFSVGGPTPFTRCWVGLNSIAGGLGTGLYVAPCNEDGTFSISPVWAGTYSVVIWDSFLNYIFGTYNLTVNNNGTCVTPAGTNGTCNLGDVSVFNWFARVEAHVFFDTNENGFWDAGELPIPNVPVNLRFRDGTLYQSITTDLTGLAPLPEVFPFFNWLVVEVDAIKYKATGATMIVDAGGPVPPDNGWVMPSRDQINPQPQATVNPNTGNNLSRTESGGVFTQAIQTFLGQTNYIDFGKNNYVGTENGGIAGSMTYAVIRAEPDPREANVEELERGIPRAQIVLYPNQATLNLADVDNFPFGWRTGGPRGPEDVKRSTTGGANTFSWGDALAIVNTDSWDDSLPTGCVNPTPFVIYGRTLDCYDGIRNFNQVRPGIFDGAFLIAETNNPALGAPAPLAAGDYIVEGVAPPGYKHVKEEDMNVAFGVNFVPSPLALKPACAGDLHVVPAELTLFPGEAAPFAGENRPLCDRKLVPLANRQNAAVEFHVFTDVPIASQFTGMVLNDAANEFDPNSPNFGEKQAPRWIPISVRDWTGLELYRVYTDEWGRYNGMVPSTYTAHLPVPTGVMASMMTMCMNDPGPIPDPAVPGSLIIDPQFDRQFSQFCYTFQFMPGATTYLDTPVIPIAAHAGSYAFPLDCECADGTPKIYSVNPVNNLHGAGPVLRAGQTGRQLVIVSEGNKQVLNPFFTGDAGSPTAVPRYIARDYGFGTRAAGATGGTVRITNAQGQNILLSTPTSNAGAVTTWSNNLIQVQIPDSFNGNTSFEGQLTITRSNGRSTISSVTVQSVAANFAPAGGRQIHRVAPSTSATATPIQTAIDTANVNDIIVIAPGRYDEMVILHKPVTLQGWGPGSVTINPVQQPAEKLTAWRARIEQLTLLQRFDYLPGQPTGFTGLEPASFKNAEGAGILVLGKYPRVAPATAEVPNPAILSCGGAAGQLTFACRPVRIDGITIFGARTGGGIMVNGYAHNLRISNNNLVNNNGIFSGAIRLGHPDLFTTDPVTTENSYSSADNLNIRIQNNLITQNGGVAGINGAGGGIGIFTGADNYRIEDNFICGNYMAGNGGGIGHWGRSDNGRIERNEITFNQTFNQLLSASGGGIFIAGAPALGPAVRTPGSGSVFINRNLILGNHAGSGDGGGIRLQDVNGLDIRPTGAESNTANTNWFRIRMSNNKIVNNVAGTAGAGVSLQDVALSAMFHNTIANNDSTATSGAAFTPGNPNISNFQPAGVVSRAHVGLAGLGTGSTFSNPNMRNNIIHQNRTFRFNFTLPPAQWIEPRGGTPNNSTTGPYWDVGVVGGGTFNAQNTLFTVVPAGYGTSNFAPTLPATGNQFNPVGFAQPYLNGRQNSIQQVETTTIIEAQPAFDEGGNFIDVRFGPLSRQFLSGTTVVTSNYHILTTSPARGRGTTSLDATFNTATFAMSSPDFDGQARVIQSPGVTAPAVSTNPDVGADETN